MLDACPILKQQACAGEIVYGINVRHAFSGDRKKTLDLAIGTPHSIDSKSCFRQTIYAGTIKRVLISCEAKSVMTEHGKSKPRLYDELSSAHEIVHGNDRQAMAAGVTVVNIAKSFVSPLRQQSGQLLITPHKQPAAEGIVNHLRGLPIRTRDRGVGFDAYATIVVDCDNQGPATLWKSPPAPQPNEPDHYDFFIRKLADLYAERFKKL